jgi:hypothetical protein
MTAGTFRLNPSTEASARPPLSRTRSMAGRAAGSKPLAARVTPNASRMVFFALSAAAAGSLV